mmetsp:Transcript_66976/g.193543  ORF Transcript_66976/g.193543 Transcript_66976/m.193543 type:complete len:362 (-) Transcript_66976:172-1257(-)
MSGPSNNHALAALVTQAPEEEEATGSSPQAAQTFQTGPPPSTIAQLCSCLFGPKREPAKLAAVVPGGGEDKQASSSARGRQAQPGAQGSASAQSPSEQRRQQQQQQQEERRQQQQERRQQQRQERESPAPQPAPQVAEQNERPPAGRQGGPRLQPCGYTEDRIWGPHRNEAPQLGPQIGKDVGRKTLVLDLDETLVHSSFRVTPGADIIITVELEGEHHKVYVRKRPGVDEFLIKVAQMYEVVVYTASMAKYANPLLDELDKSCTVGFRLFREACTRHTSGYVKDLSKLGRDLKGVIIIDNSPICYALQPDNAIPIRTWRDDMSDRELMDLIPILYSLAEVDDIPTVLKQIVWAPDEEDEG